MNLKRGRLPDMPSFPGNSINSRAVASGICQRSMRSQNCREDRIRPKGRGGASSTASAAVGLLRVGVAAGGMRFRELGLSRRIMDDQQEAPHAHDALSVPGMRDGRL